MKKMLKMVQITLWEIVLMPVNMFIMGWIFIVYLMLTKDWHLTMIYMKELHRQIKMDRKEYINN